MALEDHLLPSELVRLGKLPNWAATCIRRLAMNTDMRLHDIADLKESLAVATGDASAESTTSLVDYSGAEVVRRPLGVNPYIEHSLSGVPSWHAHFEVQFNDDGIQITGLTGPLTVLPKSTSVVEVRRAL